MCLSGRELTDCIGLNCSSPIKKATRAQRGTGDQGLGGSHLDKRQLKRSQLSSGMESMGGQPTRREE